MIPVYKGDLDVFQQVAPQALKPAKTFGSESLPDTPADALTQLNCDSVEAYTAQQHARVAKYGK